MLRQLLQQVQLQVLCVVLIQGTAHVYQSKFVLSQCVIMGQLFCNCTLLEV